MKSSGELGWSCPHMDGMGSPSSVAPFDSFVISHKFA